MDSNHRSTHSNSKSDKKSPKKIRHPSLAGPSHAETHQVENLVTEFPANNDSQIPSLKLDSPVEHRTPKLEVPNSKEVIAVNYLRDLEEEDDSDMIMNHKYKEDIPEENDLNNSFRLSPFMGPIRKSVHKKSLEGGQEDRGGALIKVNKTIQMKRGTGQTKTRQSRLRTDPNEEYSRLQKSNNLTLNEDHAKRISTKSGGGTVVNQVKMTFPAHLAKSEEPRPARIMQELKGNKNIKSVKDIKVLFAESANNALLAQLGIRKALNIRARQTYKKTSTLVKGPDNILLVGRSYSVPKFAQQQQLLQARQSANRTPDLQRFSIDLRKDSQQQPLPLLVGAIEENESKTFTKYITEEKMKLGEHYGNGNKIYLQTLLKEAERTSLKKKQLHLKDSVSSVEEGISSAALDGWDKSNLKDASVESKPREVKKVNEVQVGFWFKAKKNLINPHHRIEEGKNEPNDENKVAIKELLGDNILKVGKVPGSYQLKSIRSIEASPKKEENMSPILISKGSNFSNPRMRLMSRQNYSFKDPIHQGDFVNNPVFSKTSTKGFKINIPPTQPNHSHSHKKSFTGGETVREEIKKPLDLLKYPIRGGVNIAKTAR